MKKRIFNIKTMAFALMASSSLIVSSCSEWLNVQPSTQKSADEMFSKESGFKSALTGVYTLMVAPELYGRELTFGAMDYFGQYWKAPAQYNRYEEVYKYKFEDSKVLLITDAIWKKQYNTIANINDLLAYADANRSVFASEQSFNVIKGEALGLRAYLHLDVLRAFAPSFIDPRATEKWLPYVDEFSRNTTESLTNSEFIAKVIVDLERASELLKKDPIYTGVKMEDQYFENRHFHFNYYAARATLARAYLYAGDKVKAEAAAKEVIDAQSNKGLFRWITSNEVTFSVPAHRDRTFSTEHIFALNVRKMKDHINTYFMPATATTVILTAKSVNTIYGAASEFRKTFFEISGGIADVPSKLFQLDQDASASLKQQKERMPLLRISEMYYIMAECTGDIHYLNEVRINRGLDPLAVSADLMTELKNEVEKEFISEGQRFYFHKRFGGNIDREVPSYIIPMPQVEIDFGGRPRPTL